MSKTKSEQTGFTLIEMMIAVAIIGILSIIAIPSYRHYIEQGRLSQAHSELLNLNSSFKTALVKNPALDIATELPKFVANFTASGEVAEKYAFSSEVTKDSRSYRLSATPKAGSGYTLAVWMDSLGNAYKCKDAASASSFSTSGQCEKISNQKKK